MDASHLASNHKEADTKLLLLDLDATNSGATSIEIMSPNTDVFVLSLRRFPQLCQNTTFVKGRGEHLQRIAMRRIVNILGPAKIAVLLGFHTWSGADMTRGFAGKQKTWHVMKLLVLVLNYLFL